MLCIVQVAYETKGPNLAHKVLTNQHNFTRYLTVQKRQHLIFKNKCNTYEQKLHQTLSLLKLENPEKHFTPIFSLIKFYYLVQLR